MLEAQALIPREGRTATVRFSYKKLQDYSLNLTECITCGKLGKPGRAPQSSGGTSMTRSGVTLVNILSRSLAVRGIPMRPKDGSLRSPVAPVTASLRSWVEGLTESLLSTDPLTVCGRAVLESTERWGRGHVDLSRAWSTSRTKAWPPSCSRPHLGLGRGARMGLTLQPQGVAPPPRRSRHNLRLIGIGCHLREFV